jgi:hypothetical protein
LPSSSQRQAVPDPGRTAAPISRRSSPYPETTFGGDFRDLRPTTAIPFLQELIAKKGGTMIWPPIRYPLRHPQSRSADAGAVAADLAAHRSAVQAVVEKKKLSGCKDPLNTTGSAPTTRAAT